MNEFLNLKTLKLKKKEVKKGMKKLALASFVLVTALLIFSVTAQAQPVPFVNPPETSGQPWVTSSPYQRNILWTFDFGSNPPESDADGYVSDVAGAQYSGYDDGALKDSDYVQLNNYPNNPIEYYESITIDTVTRYGLIGIDNRVGSDLYDGQTTYSGSVTAHIDNWERNWPLKHLYKEIVFADNGVTSNVVETLGLPGGYINTDGWASGRIYQDDYFDLQNVWYEIQPNPYWEDITLTFTALPGQYALVDSIHVATECIPEPGTMILLGSLATGLFGFAGLKRRFSH